MAAAHAAARMRLERVRFVGLSRAQVRAAARTGGGRQRPQREEETVGHYAVVQGAYMRPAGAAVVARLPVPMGERLCRAASRRPACLAGRTAHCMRPSIYALC